MSRALDILPKGLSWDFTFAAVVCLIVDCAAVSFAQEPVPGPLTLENLLPPSAGDVQPLAPTDQPIERPTQESLFSGQNERRQNQGRQGSETGIGRTAALDRPKTGQAAPEGAYRRPADTVSDETIDAAWKNYSICVGQAVNGLSEKIKQFVEEALDQGIPQLAAYWQCANRRFETFGELPRHKSIAPDVAAFRRSIEDASKTLCSAYSEQAKALKEAGDLGLAVRVTTELSRLKSPSPSMPQAFDPRKYGLRDTAGLGADILKSWENTPAKNAIEFSRRGLPPHDGHGVLIRELRPNHARGLLRNDIIQSIDGTRFASDDAWNAALEGVRVGEPVSVQIERPGPSGWRWNYLTIALVSDAKQRIAHDVVAVLPKGCKPVLRLDLTKAADIERMVKIREDALRERIPPDVIDQAFDDQDGQFGLLTVAVASKEAPVIVTAFEALGPKRISAMTELIKRTDWGRLPSALDPSRTNGRVVLDAWKATLEARD